jgi:hypothetical protein
VENSPTRSLRTFRRREYDLCYVQKDMSGSVMKDLLTYPRDVLCRIGHFIDVDLMQVAYAVSAGDDAEVGHNIAGNHLRTSERGRDAQKRHNGKIGCPQRAAPVGGIDGMVVTPTAMNRKALITSIKYDDSPLLEGAPASSRSCHSVTRMERSKWVIWTKRRCVYERTLPMHCCTWASSLSTLQGE